MMRFIIKHLHLLLVHASIRGFCKHCEHAKQKLSCQSKNYNDAQNLKKTSKIIGQKQS